MQGALAKERRDMKIQQQREKDSNKPRGSIGGGGSSRMHDPMAAPAGRGEEDEAPAFMAHKRERDMPEWMRHVTANGKVSFGRRTNLSIKEQRESLPIYSLKEPLVQAIQDNQYLVVIGETGSGKTTQMTQYMVEAGFTRRGKIGCTQPR